MMGTPGWTIALFLLLGLVVLANYAYETSRLVTCRHCGDQGAPGEDHTCPCPHPDETCPDHPAQRDGAWLELLLRARTRALGRVVRERDELRELVVRAAQLERAGWLVYKLRAQGDELVRPSAIITNAEGGARRDRD